MIKIWLKAARLRTLPLSVSGILMGGALAKSQGQWNTPIFVLALLTAIGFQITSNFANDYGDGVKGTDNEERIGPKRVLQSGLLSRQQLKNGIIVSIIICILLVLATIYLAFGIQHLGYPLLFILLGGASIWAAIRYTVGENAYGYRGLGDVFVFVFFGLLAVLGSLFLFTKSLRPLDLLPAISIGLLSVAVLNLNNLRDHNSDKASGKNTLIVLMGFTKGKRYHYGLILLAFAALLIFVLLSANGWTSYLPLLLFVPLLLHLATVKKTQSPEKLDPELKKVALSTFALSLAACILF